MNEGPLRRLKTRPKGRSRSFQARTGPAALRRLVVALSVLSILGAGVVWSISRAAKSDSSSTTTVTEYERSPSNGMLRPSSKEQTKQEETRPSSLGDSQPFILALLSLGTAGLLATMFFARLEELSVLGLTLRLSPAVAEAVETIAVRASSSELAGQAAGNLWQNLVRETIRGGPPDPLMLQRLVRQSLSDVGVRDRAADVEVSGTPEAPVIAVHALLDTTLISNRDYLASSTFPDDAHQQLEGLDNRLFAIDRDSEEVAAALGFQVARAANALLIPVLAFSRLRDIQDASDLGRMLELLSYCAVIAEQICLNNVIITPTASTNDSSDLLIRLACTPLTQDESRPFGVERAWRFRGD